MAGNKKTPEGASAIFDKVSDIFGKADKGLDQVKKSIHEDLDELNKHKNLESLGANLFSSALEGFKKDLDELGIHEEKQAEYIAEFQAAWQSEVSDSKAKEIINSPEAQALDGFISKAENLPKLKALMDSTEPKAKWEVFLNDIASKYLGFKPGDPESEGMMANIKKWAAETFGLGFLVKKGVEVQKENESKEGEEANDKKNDEGSEVNAEKKDQELLTKNITEYRKVLDGTTTSPSFEALLQAREGKSELFDMKGEDLEAQAEAVNQFIKDKLKGVGEVDEVKPDMIAFKAKEGETKQKFELTKNADGNHFVKLENSMPVKFDGDLDSLVQAIESLSKTANS